MPHLEARCSPSRLTSRAAAAIRAAIALAGGREVCFVATLDEGGVVQRVRVVARGDVGSVLALPGFAERGEMLLHNHPSGRLDPSDADLDVAARVHDGGIGFGIVDNAAGELYVVVEVPRDRPPVRLDLDAMRAELGPDGPVAAHLVRYEDRASQREMAASIARLYNGGGIGLFEAGTGVGKSLGYLIPALRWAAANGERTIVSTNTINLQEQLVGKDLPLLAGALSDQKVRFALLKGWRNYVCLQRLEQAGAQGGGGGVGPSLFERGVAAEIDMLRDWAAGTADGSLADLPTPPSPEAWDEVAAEADLCGRLTCPHFDRCFVFAARRRAAEADVIVVNHHLLLADLSVRRAQQNWGDAAVLPAYRRLVIDEGHHLEDAAAAHLGTTVTRRALERLLSRLERRGGRGLLASLAAKLSAREDLYSVASLDLVTARLVPSVRAAREKGGVVFALLDVVLAESGEHVMRLTDGFADHPVWRGGLDAALTDLLREIALLRAGLQMVRERLEIDAGAMDVTTGLVREIRGVVRRLESLGDGLARALRPPPDSGRLVRWLEVRGRERHIAAAAVPLDIAPILREDLFARVETAIVTSATLAENECFTFLVERLGLTEPEVEPETAVFPSPFDFAEQALFVVPTDVPPPNVDAAAHLRATVDVLRDLAAAADGGLFALFTSHRDLRAAAAALRACPPPPPDAARWPLLVHGEDGRDALLRRFRESGRALLLGTSSFWEGVDVPGDALRGLLIAKLPFRVPTEPLTAAHAEAIAERGGDPFREFMLPHAALRLKQGFGRLIRSGTDRGVVVLCDPRVVTKSYGESLLATLPPARRVIDTWERARLEVTRFYGRHR
ncbi:MAG TPA: helicase C-terminal domain-containing protein [Gemmatimonadaceae bacterium]